MGSYAEAGTELERIRTAIPGVKVRRDPDTETGASDLNADNLLLVQDNRPEDLRLADAVLAIAAELVHPGRNGYVRMESEAGESVYFASSRIV